MGNERANCYWEAELPPNYDRVGIENFIRAKYVDYFLFLSSLCSFSGIFSSLPLQIVKVSIYSKMEKLSHMLLHYMNDNDIYPFLAISSKRFPKYPPWGILYIKSKQIRIIQEVIFALLKVNTRGRVYMLFAISLLYIWLWCFITTP